MKKFISLLLAATIIAFAVFAILHWLVGSDMAASLEWAFIVGLTGLIIEYLRPYIARWSSAMPPDTKRK